MSKNASVEEKVKLKSAYRLHLKDWVESKSLSAYTESENKWMHQLLEGRQLGDEKPSHLLRQMRQLAGETVANEMSKNLMDA